MDYEEAEGIRKKSFGSLLANQEGGLGTSLKKTLSLKSKAKMTGIKEFFDPMNMAKKLTGGGNLAPALIGKLFKRDQKSMERFAGATKKTVSDSPEQAIEENESSAIQTLGLIYKELVRTKEDKRLQDELEKNQKEGIDKLREDEDTRRNKEIIEALKGKGLTRKQKKAETRAKRKEEKRKVEEGVTTPPPSAEVPKPTTPTTPAKPTKTPKIEAPTAKPTKTPKAEAPTAKPAEAPKPKVEAPKVEAPTAKPAEMPTPKTPTPTAKPAAPSTPSATTATKVPPVTMSGSKGLVLGALVAAGYSKSAQANMMANVEKESNFRPRSEEVPQPEKIFSMFGPPGVKGGQPENGKNKVRFQTLQDAQDIVAAGPEAYFNKVYDGRKNLGNTTPGDGYKYRGRGFIQITGRDMYNQVGKLIGEDLIGNPDLANTPEVAAKIIPAFFQLKLKERKLNVEAYDDIDKVNEIVGSADTESRKKRKTLAAAYANELNTGSQIDQMSKENKDLKQSPSGTQSGGNVNTSLNISHTTNETAINSDRPDDRSAQEKKRKG